MDVEQIRLFCLSLNATSEGFPFGPEVLIFKVGEKMFASLSMENPCAMNLKCDPEKAIELREDYDGIIPGYHMNKKHWNTIHSDKDVTFGFLKQLIQDSYHLVIIGMTKKQRSEYGV